MASVTSMQHRALAATGRRPPIDTYVPAINTTPIELDGTPTSPVARQERLRAPVRSPPAEVDGVASAGEDDPVR